MGKREDSVKLVLEMDKDDWRMLFHYAQAANAVKAIIEQAAAAGKQQVSIKQEEVERFLTLNLPPGFWIKLGGLISSKLQEEDE